uniref:Uncharacterized protein n=1 Tax=Anolis carolinensis TaxID=28377 RepID=A0A803T2Q7_ANOCA
MTWCSNMATRVVNKKGGVQLETDLLNKKVNIELEVNAITVSIILKKMGGNPSYIGEK